MIRPALAIALAGLALGVIVGNVPPQEKEPPFGGPKDVAFAKKVWEQMKGYEDWKLTSPVYKGGSPHGKLVRLFSTFVTIDGKSHPVIIKDNYGGRGVTTERATKDRKAWLKAVTIMLKRDPGYDPDHGDWFWVKYDPDGTIAKNDKGMPLAGRVAKGMTRGCISCHAQAGGGDYLFSNDH